MTNCYRFTVYGFDSGMNELLSGRLYDYRTRKYRNSVKSRNDKVCAIAIRNAIGGVRIAKPIKMHFNFYCKNKRRDRMNVASAFEKSFSDALQECNIIKNDGWDDILNVTYDFHIDKDNPRVEVAIMEVEDGEN